MREWGEKAFHNALIFSTDLEGQDIENPQEVKVWYKDTLLVFVVKMVFGCVKFDLCIHLLLKFFFNIYFV